MKVQTIISVAVIAATASMSFAAGILTPMASFGGGDGWRAPSEVITGDTAGTATAGAYNYLQVAGLERGMAYNPVTGNLVIVSRSSVGNGIRILNGTTGVDTGALNQGSGVITGGAFTTNMVGAGTDGQIYVGNLTTNASTSPYKVYQWTSEGAATPTTFGNTAGSAFRVGDSLDAIGGGASTRLVAGYSGTTGYQIYDNAGALSNVTPIAGLTNGDLRLGVTFAQNDANVWGKQTGAGNDLRRTSYSGAVGTHLGSNVLTSAGEMAMDYAVIGGIPFLATVDANNSTVRVYDASDPTNLVLSASGTTTSGTLTANGNAVGSVRWGAISGVTATLYAMSTNQGIQAFNFTVPEPTTLTAVAGLGMLMGRRRK